MRDMLRKYILFILAAICISCLSSCSNPADSGEDIRSRITGKTFVYEGEGFGGDFSIEIKEDGSFSYYEGALSSYIGMGKWTLDGDILCLSDSERGGMPLVNYFRVDENDLVFLAEDSSGFAIVEVSEGERFSGRDQ